MKRVPWLLLVAIVAAWAGSPASAPDPAASATAASATAARRYTEWFLAGSLDSLVARLSPPLLERVRGREGLAAFQAEVARSLGDSVTAGKTTTETREGIVLCRQTLVGRVTGMEAEIVWGLDSLGTVARFSVRPRVVKEAPSKYLAHESKAPLRLPFEGEWTVFAGGRTLDQNHHAGARNQRFALDLAIVRNGTTHGGDGSKLEEYHCWGAAVLAPAAGTVVAAVDTFPDNPMGTTDRDHAAGNHVTLDHGGGEYSFLAHFQRGSVAVRAGEKVSSGQRLGRVGNSGNTSEPHLHYHLQDSPGFPNAECMPAAFHDYVADDRLVARGEPLKGQRIRPR